MPRVLTTNALIVCPHGGKGTSIPTDPKWSINNGIVLLENDTGMLTCPFIPLPCASYQLKSMGLNATQIDGRKVILETDFNQTLTGLPLLITDFHQTFDDSTVAPIPSGQSAPPLPAELSDTIRPLVTGVPPALAFNSTTMLPPTLLTTFTLTSDHPLQWILTLINEPQKRNLDVTNGLPPALVVAPPGGSWATSALVVTVTMTNLFMASLGIGMHHFYMTAVSRRGLSSYSEVKLTVI
jgi:hypothetical protein